MTKFDAQNTNTIYADLSVALKAVGQKHGIKLSMGRLKYRETTFNFGVDAAIESTDPRLAKVAPKWIDAIKKYRDTAELFMKEFVWNGENFTVVGRYSREKAVVWSEKNKSLITLKGVFSKGSQMNCLIRGVPYNAKHDFSKLFGH